MDIKEIPVGDEQVGRPRYSVSRAGMGGRKPKYTESDLNTILVAVRGGQSLLAVCKEKNLPYVSIRSALKRTGSWPVNVKQEV